MSGAPGTDETVELNNGVAMPRLGLGVFRAPRGDATKEAVREALRAGYRHIDTARIYGNELDVGDAIRESGIDRQEVFVTTKLWNEDQGYDQALRAFESSRRRLGFDYIDLYLIHWPVPERRLESWRALERIFTEGGARAIGVSNFMTRHLEELLLTASVVPAVNQIEVHPFLQQTATRALCASRGIAVQAYSPLTKGKRLDHPVVVEIANALDRTPAQVMLRWGLQQNVTVLPKSTQRERIRENGRIFDFELDSEAMQRLDALEEGLVTGWDPSAVP